MTLTDSLSHRKYLMLYFAVPEVTFLPLSEMDTKKSTEVGNPIVLYCEVSHPTATVQWFKDGQALHVEEGLNIQSDGNMRRIVIQSAEYSHSGVYTCQSNNNMLTFNVNVEGENITILKHTICIFFFDSGSGDIPGTTVI